MSQIATSRRPDNDLPTASIGMDQRIPHMLPQSFRMRDLLIEQQATEMCLRSSHGCLNNARWYAKDFANAAKTIGRMDCAHTPAVLLHLDRDRCQLSSPMTNVSKREIFSMKSIPTSVEPAASASLTQRSTALRKGCSIQARFRSAPGRIQFETPNSRTRFTGPACAAPLISVTNSPQRRRKRVSW